MSCSVALSRLLCIFLPMPLQASNMVSGFSAVNILSSHRLSVCVMLLVILKAVLKPLEWVSYFHLPLYSPVEHRLVFSHSCFLNWLCVVQILLIFLQKMDLLLTKTPPDDIKNSVLPMVYRALEAPSVQIQVQRGNGNGEIDYDSRSYCAHNLWKNIDAVL